jgi:hypothetical protein
MSVKPSSVVYWFRFMLGIIVGVVCFMFRMQGMEGVSTMVLVYILSYLVVKHGFRYGEKELKGKYKTVMVGIGTYIFTWAATWILLYSLNPYPLSSS